MGKSTKRDLFPIHFLIVIGFMFLFRYFPAPAPMTAEGMAVLGVFIGLIYGWTFTSDRGLAWTSLLGLIALGLVAGKTCTAALSALFGSSNSILILFGMLLVGPVMASNMGDYLIAKLLKSKLCYKKPWTFTILIVVVLPLLGVLINPWVIILFLLPVLASMFNVAGYKPGDRYPVMLLIGFFVTLEITSALLPWRMWGLFCVSAFSSATGGYTIDYAPYMITLFVFYFALAIGYVLLMRVMRCDVEPLRNIDLSNFVKEEQTGLTKKQKVLLALVIGMAVGCVAVSFASGTSTVATLLKQIGVHGVFLFILVCMFVIRVDGEPIGTIEQAGKSLSWDLMLVIAVAMVIANALTASSTGISEWMASIAGPLLGGRSEVIFLIMLGIITLILTNLSNNTAVMFVFMAVAGSLYSTGVITNAPATMVVVTVASNLGFYTPGASAYGAAIHGFEYSTSKSVYVYGAIAIALILFLLFAVVIPLSYILW